MARTVLTRRVGDLINHDYNKKYSVVDGTLKNATAGTITVAVGDLMGQPVKQTGTQWEFVVAADIANATGIVLAEDDISLATTAITTTKYPILVRGPVAIEQDQLPANDVEDAAITVATWKTAMEALSPPIIFHDDTAQETEQSW